jgi:hypothetical protein
MHACTLGPVVLRRLVWVGKRLGEISTVFVRLGSPAFSHAAFNMHREFSYKHTYNECEYAGCIMRSFCSHVDFVFFW